LEEHLAAFFAWLPSRHGSEAFRGRTVQDACLGRLRHAAAHGDFFPLFTLLEDSGYLPRIAFNLDNFSERPVPMETGTHHVHGLRMQRCRRDRLPHHRFPPERLIAIITNNFVPCNGRFPTLIAIIMMFFAGVSAGVFQTVVSTAMLTGTIVLGVCMTS
jgi:ferrous iron transport protein B